ncbi:MAG: DUF58 domain-containing protein [Pirellulaceae bacterium]|nr:DUF58 domain-containing protein [Pirellulaceae bacterium]
MTPTPGNTCPTSFDPRTIAKLQGLALRARHIVEGYVAGLHRSPYRGFSIEFAEHREYAPGDDLRYVDWKVFGRTDKFYLKQYEDETNLICYLVLDISESMRYQGPGGAMSKLEYAQCLAAAMAWLVLQQQDAVGLVTFDNEIRANVAPSSNASHLRTLLQVMEDVRPEAKTATGPIFHELAERFRKRGVVLILSDLFDDVGSLMAGLKHFAHRRHDVILLHTLDPAELDFPFRSPTMFDGLEQYPELLTDPRSLRKAYLQEITRFCNEVQKGCRRYGMDYQQLRTDQPLDQALSKYLADRSERIK